MKKILFFLFAFSSVAAFGQAKRHYKSVDDVCIGCSSGVIVTYKDKKGKTQTDSIGTQPAIKPKKGKVIPSVHNN